MWRRAAATGVQVQFTVDVVDRSGGHEHIEGRHVWPHRGYVLVQNAYTDADGYVDFTFRAPAAAGDHTIKAECLNMICGQDERKVWVGMKDLVSLYDTHLYRLVGSIQPHRQNHFLTLSATGNLVWLAERYKARFPADPVLHLNDASLERGGIFDLRANWQPSHHSHRYGLAIDMVANPEINPSMAIPAGNFERFEEMACGTGWWANLELPGTINQHFHAEFELRCFAANTESVAVADATPPTTECGPNPDPQTMPWCF